MSNVRSRRALGSHRQSVAEDRKPESAVRRHCRALLREVQSSPTYTNSPSPKQVSMEELELKERELQFAERELELQRRELELCRLRSMRLATNNDVSLPAFAGHTGNVFPPPDVAPPGTSNSLTPIQRSYAEELVDECPNQFSPPEKLENSNQQVRDYTNRSPMYYYQHGISHSVPPPPGFQPNYNCLRQQQYMEPAQPNLGSAYTGNPDVKQLIGALHTMTNSVNRAQTGSVPKEELFDGSPTKYHRFIRFFEAYTIQGVTNPATMLNLLISSCTGEARESIANCIMCPTPMYGYQEARKILQRNFGQIENVLRAHISQLTDGPSLRAQDTKAIAKLARDMRSCLVTCGGIPSAGLDTQQTVGSVFRRLPRFMQDKFLSSLSNQLEQGWPISFTQLTEFVERQASVNQSYLGQFINSSHAPGFPSAAKPSVSKRTVLSTLANPASQGTPPETCLCGKRQGLWKCPKFQSLSVEERWKIARLRKVCFNCFGKHLAKNCASNFTCRVCSGKHHSLLHRSQMRQDLGRSDDRKNGGRNVNQASVHNIDTNTNSEVLSTSTSASVHCASSSTHGNTQVRLKVLPVTVSAIDGTNKINTFAFLDEGSDTTLCSANLKKKLGARGARVRYSITTMNGTSVEDSYKLSLKIKGVDEHEIVQLDNVLAVHSLPQLSRSIPCSMDKERFPQVMDGIHIPNIDANQVELLIGADAPVVHRTCQFKPGHAGEPNAMLTILGWTLCGPTSIEEKYGTVCVNLIHTVTDPLHDQLMRMYSHDFNDGPNQEELSLSWEDRRAQCIMKESLRLENGHYALALPWKSDQVVLPYNRSMAEKRLMHLRRRFEKDDEFYQKYKEKIKEYIHCGYAQKIPNDSLSPTERTWYIPHHATGTKFRVVFDCAAKFKGTSLNENLLQGPDHTSNLVGVLLRFRHGPIAVVGDIRSMFHQVKVLPCDWESLRFLWWSSDDLSQPAEDYQMMVHLFGATSSPSCCGFALRSVADDETFNVDEETAEAIKHNFYVDDFLKSFHSEEVAIEAVRKLREALDQVGFHLTKFVSNSLLVSNSVPVEDQAIGSVPLDLDKVKSPKALGLIWNTSTDDFGIKVDICDKALTRRGMLSMVSQVYDPLGVVQPFVLPAKKLIQQLCAEELGWDDPIPDETRRAWQQWLSSLHHLQGVKINRCFHSQKFNPVRRQIHCFCDASSIGYGAVAYLRMVDAQGNVQCSFILGKARVAPLKSVTIPRLELTAAVVAVRLVQFVKRELDLEVEGATFWTDSTSVMQYIHNKTKRFQVFVANRIAAIHTGSKPEQWRYVDTSKNPADIASRGAMPGKLEESRIWFNGPGFLLQSEEEWPFQPTAVSPVPADDPELIRSRHINTTLTMEKEITETATSRLLKYFSSFFKLQRAVAYLLRFKANLKDKVAAVPLAEQRGKLQEKLSVEELDQAMSAIVKLVQEESFPSELHVLKDQEDFTFQPSVKDKCIRKSCLQKLCPFLVRGILRVGGRLQNSPLSNEEKHPAILPGNHPVTSLIINWYHVREGHCGPLHTLCATRERFWILKGKTAVRKVLHDCLLCKSRNARSGQQIMAPLPDFRVSPGGPAFTCTGVDYAGPVLTKIGRSQHKRYICVFTCMATRAVHIEMASSLDTYSFLQAYQRFVNRHNVPRHLYSDNGSNFVGAARELREGIKRWNQKAIHSKLLQQGVDWHFNRPAASHQGGVWERIIRSAKKILHALTAERTLDDESLATFLTEVERVLNDRPITPVSSEPDDLETLSPNTLLSGSLRVALPPDEFVKADGYRKSWRLVNWLADEFWKRWTKSYLPILPTEAEMVSACPKLCRGGPSSPARRNE